jgi:hypothetical protein
MTKDARRVRIRERIEERTKGLLAELDRQAREQMEIMRATPLEDEFEPEASKILKPDDEEL